MKPNKIKNKNTKQQGGTAGKWHCGLKAFCEHGSKLGAWIHLISSCKLLKNRHIRPFLWKPIDFNKCSYCGIKKNLLFSWMEGTICKKCSPQWHKNHPMALSEKDIDIIKNIIIKNTLKEL